MLDPGYAGAADTGRESLDARASVCSGGSVGSDVGEGEEGGPEAEYDSAGAADGSGDSPSTVEDAELEEAEASLRAAEELLTAGDLWERAQAGKAEVSAVASQIDALLLSHNEALNEWHQMQQAVDRARDEHRKACGRLGDVEGRSAAAAARTAELEASVKRTDAALARLREVAKEAKALKSRLSGAEGERSKLCSEKDRDSKALQVAKGTVGSLEASKRGLDSELADVRQELLLAEEEAAGSAPAWRTEAEAVRAQLKAAQESERSCAALAASAEKALAPLRQEAARLRRDRDAVEATHASAVAAAAQAASDAAALEAQVAREAAEWQIFVTTESASLRELQRACAGAVEEMSILQSVNSAMSEQVAVFRELNVRLAEGRDAALAGLPMHVGGGMRHAM
jgi:chromosome segregation ATPase